MLKCIVGSFTGIQSEFDLPRIHLFHYAKLGMDCTPLGSQLCPLSHLPPLCSSTNRERQLSHPNHSIRFLIWLLRSACGGGNWEGWHLLLPCLDWRKDGIFNITSGWSGWTHSSSSLFAEGQWYKEGSRKWEGAKDLNLDHSVRPVASYFTLWRFLQQ